MADRIYRRRLSLLLPKIERKQKLGKEAVFRAHAAFAKRELYKALEERDVKYTIRLPANVNRQRKITGLLKRPAQLSAGDPGKGKRQGSENGVRKPQLWLFRRQGGQNWLKDAPRERASALKTGSTCVCKAPGACASLTRNFKMEIPG